MLRTKWCCGLGYHVSGVGVLGRCEWLFEVHLDDSVVRDISDDEIDHLLDTTHSNTRLAIQRFQQRLQSLGLQCGPCVLKLQQFRAEPTSYRDRKYYVQRGIGHKLLHGTHT